MTVSSFSLFKSREIKCKSFVPEGNVELAVLGVHGFAGDKESSALRRLAEKLSKKGGALICFDFPAHGESPAAEDHLTVDNCIEDLLFVAECLRREYPAAKKAVFATSFGGYISLLASDRLSDFDFVLRAPAVTMPRILLETVLKTDRKSFKASGVIVCGFDRKMALPFSFSEDLDRQESLFEKPFPRPALIIHGTEDDIVPFSHIEKYCALHPSARLIPIVGADHRFKKERELEQVIALACDYLTD